MPSDRQLIEIDKAALRRQYRGPAQTTGPLVAGKVYEIAILVSGDNFANVGASVSVCGYLTNLIFTATGTTPTAWTHGSTLYEWKLADLQALAASFFEAAPSDMEITSTGFEGGTAGFQLTYRKSLRLAAIEELIAEIDPGFASPRPRSSGSLLVFTP